MNDWYFFGSIGDSGIFWGSPEARK